MAQIPTDPMLTDPESWVLRLLNSRPLTAWALLAALVALMVVLIVGMPA